MEQPDPGNSDFVSTQEQYHLSLYTRLLRGIMRPLFRVFFHLFMNVKLSGLENIPQQGPYLIAINHVSLYDPPFILAFWPVAPEAAGAADLWGKPGISTLARLYGGIPVHRGQYDRKLIDTMVAVLAAGRPLLIAPEGTRSHNPGMNQALPGVVFVTDRARVPVIPVGIIGTTEDLISQSFQFKRPTVEMRVGQALMLPPLDGRGEQRRWMRQAQVDEIMLRIAEVLPAEYRGVYGEKFTRLNQTPNDTDPA
jgi:1-acyl-sn-glycerol-3-phosphate acyltransferase